MVGVETESPMFFLVSPTTGTVSPRVYRDGRDRCRVDDHCTLGTPDRVDQALVPSKGKPTPISPRDLHRSE